MRNYLDTSGEWDLGLAEIIEEAPVINPNHPTHFEKVDEADGVHVYLLRPRPSWSHLKAAA